MEGGRKVGVAVDFSACSNRALKWALDNVARKGDKLILVTIRPQEFYKKDEMQLWETTGSPSIHAAEFCDPTIVEKYGVKLEAEFLDIVKNAEEQKKADIMMKVYWGDAREKLCEAVNLLPLDYLIIGNRGLSTIRRTIMGSVSNYVVNNASCPVTVVKFEREDH